MRLVMWTECSPPAVSTMVKRHSQPVHACHATTLPLRRPRPAPHLLGLGDEALEHEAHLGIEYAAPPPLQLRTQGGRHGASVCSTCTWANACSPSADPRPAPAATRWQRPRLQRPSPRTLRVCPALVARGRTTQKGSGWNVLMAWWRSTQNCSVGVWQGPYEMSLLSRLPYLLWKKRLWKRVKATPTCKAKAMGAGGAGSNEQPYTRRSATGLGTPRTPPPYTPGCAHTAPTSHLEVQLLAGIHCQGFGPVGRHQPGHGLLDLGRADGCGRRQGGEGGREGGEKRARAGRRPAPTWPSKAAQELPAWRSAAVHAPQPLCNSKTLKKSFT